MAYLPPYRDPELRRAFALGNAEQCALLRRMAGEPDPIPALPTFSPHPIDVRRTAKALVALTRPLPSSVVMTDTSTQLFVLVEHHAFPNVINLGSRQQPRHPEAVAELEAALTNIAPNLGVWSVPFPRPATWTRATVRRLLSVLASYIPDDGRKLQLRAEWSGSYREYFEITVEQRAPSPWRQLAERPYSASIWLDHKTAEHALGAWFEVFSRSTGSSLAEIDKALQAHQDRESASNRHSRGPTRRLYDEDDRDLDFIERAAKRALHGDNEPEDAEAEDTDGADADETPLQQKLRKLLRVRPIAGEVIERIIDGLLAEGPL